MDPKPSLPTSDMICFALYSATHAMQHAYKPLLEALGLTYPQYLVLVALWGSDGQTVGQLGQALQLESNTLTPLLKRMEAQGLVARARDAKDERQVRVSLSTAGREMQARAAGIPGCILERSGMSLAGLTALRDQVNALRDQLRGA
ncbi:MarR family winged helix-turn-helix transcriptional regulator [Cypionkella sp.]|uniref:MarR family winged helix-turn-helix transcriptional regulator n=1 Tax=Cypionkella sp. TaxID=2811411 RepID=UPI00272056EB|nr:MarR family transcriptional regulator [Cypionkella sp.]MDO8984001.1 MarR family transcriptional regulator [Cypionkella sp.]MDP2049201.1 MarR family transcriptional regulator [Cypionkella sp.]